jgi:tryptophan-rich sensory protein
MIYRIILFLVLNFAGLAIGGMFTGKGVPSEWYLNLNKAPWTPPGWVFGAAWTTIMICFSIYLNIWWQQAISKRYFYMLFAALWILNVLWNPVFFHFHATGLGLVVISLLTIGIAYLLWSNAALVKQASWLLAPYFIWLLIATSLNGYIVVNN